MTNKSPVSKMKSTCGASAVAIAKLYPFKHNGFLDISRDTDEQISHAEVAARLCDSCVSMVDASKTIVEFLDKEELFWTMSKLKQSLQKVHREIIVKRKQKAELLIFPEIVNARLLINSDLAENITEVIARLRWIKQNFRYSDVRLRMVDVPHVADKLAAVMDQIQEHIKIAGK